MTYHAVIFDLDGTLLDTEAITHAAGIEAFGSMGIDVDPAFLHGLVGKDDATGGALIRAAFPDLDPLAFGAAWGAGVRRRSAAGIPLKPFALDLLSSIAQPRAIATSSGRESAARKLAFSRLPAFAHVVTFDDVARPKPAPDPYLLAARLLGVDPAACIAFEDSDVGAASARTAGMTVVQVPDLVPTDGRHAHHLAPDLLAGARAAGLIAA
jgi:beta-phosphoglucomutase-like phosphatase (HAD superfamily)